MLRQIIYTLLPFFLLPLFVGCADDYVFSSDSITDERPVEFEFLLPDELGTRAFDSNNPPKTIFQEGDVIHVLGTFNTKSLQADGKTTIEGKESRYGALRYENKKWVKVDGNDNNVLTWPTIATDGEFKAYYISQSDGVLTWNEPSKTYLLSDLTSMTDPLEAISAPKISYGHAVRLEFKHLCTHLMLEDIEPMVSTQYLFHTNGLLDPKTKEEATFYNAYSISLGKNDDGDPTLSFQFCIKDDIYKYDEIENNYISADVIESKTDDGNGEETGKFKVAYFLAPGYYETFSIFYPATAPKTYEYLKYDYKNIPDESGGVGRENNAPDLKAGQTYTLSITKSPGVEIINPPSAGGWDETGKYYDVNVEKFLKAVNGKKGYTNDKGEQILEETANGVKLLHNVNFNKCKYGKDFLDKSFYPDIDEGAVFDGDYHYIQNLASPLFRYNYGTIQNVGIKDIVIEAVSYEDSEEQSNGGENNPEHKDMSRHGALCMWNRPAATISNVRISNVTMDISVKSFIKVDGNNDDDKDGSETHNIGCVVGSNTGNISEVALAGEFKLNVTGFNEESFKNNVNASVLIGGIAGQNAGNGKIYEISSFDKAPIFKITNNCIGDIGSYSVGGVVGESSGMITGVSLSNVTIDCLNSKGVTSYIGGIVGKAEVSDTLTSEISSCIVGGSVRAGETAPYGALSSVSYIGGMVGVDLGVPVVSCRTAVSVYGSEKAAKNVTYATGGAFGCIRENARVYTYKDLMAFGSKLIKPEGDSNTNYIGNFAGAIPEGLNYAEENIEFRKFEGINDIGARLGSMNSGN